MRLIFLLTLAVACPATAERPPTMSPRSGCAYHLSPDPDSLRYAEPPQAAANLAGLALAPTFGLAIAAPSAEDQLRAMYPAVDYKISQSDLRDVTKNKAWLSKHIRSGSGTELRTATDFKSFAERQNGNFIIVVGHNQGDSLVFPDATHLPIERMFEESQSGGVRIPILVSCAATTHIDKMADWLRSRGTTAIGNSGGGGGEEPPFKWDEARCIIDRLRSFFEKAQARGQMVTTMDIKHALARAQKVTCNPKVRFIVVGLCGTAGTTLIMELTKEKSDDASTDGITTATPARKGKGKGNGR